MQKHLFQTYLTDSKVTDVEGVGTLRFEDDGNVYRWVQNLDASTINATEPVCHTIANTTTVLQSVKLPLAVNLALFAGVVKSTTIVTQYYGWVQCLGLAQVKVKGDGSAQTAGGSLLLVTGTVRMENDTAAATAPKYRKGAISLEANSSATGTVWANINAL